MDFIKFTKEGDNCGCDVNGDPRELVGAIYTCMNQNETIAIIIKAASDIYTDERAKDESEVEINDEENYNEQMI